MRKSIIKIFALLLVAGVAFVSCSKESSEIESPSNGYKVSIPANKISSKAVADGGTATFKTTENVYVCNTSNGNAIDVNVLHPSANAASANFDGTLAGTYNVGNNLKILYNTNVSGVADYSSQNGTLAGVVDAGVASVDVTDISGGTITTGTASISNLQSIFKFQFKNGGVGDPLTIKFVRITSVGNNLQYEYNAVTETASYGPIDVTNTSGITTVYVALRFDAAPSDPIIFQVVDSYGKVYTGTKNAPASTGFVNSKFYTSTISVTPHVFTVASGKTVYFAPGNLGVDGTTYSFIKPFENWGQFGGNPATLSKRAYFNWNELSSPYTVYGISSWEILTQPEWSYLLNTRTMADGVQRYYRIRDNYNSYNGLLLPPDNATSDDVAGLTSGGLTSNVDYKTYIKKGFVFLHYTGYWSSGAWRYPEYPNPASSNRGRCYYWSSAKNDSNGYCLTVNDSKVDPTDYWNKSTYYLGVLLVHE